MCWVFEFVGIAISYLTPLLLALGAFNIYFIDAILMFVMLPALYLINDEDTKTIITQQGWIQGLMITFGKSNNPRAQALNVVP